MEPSKSRYAAISSAVFALVALAHLARVATRVPIDLNHAPVPIPVSVAVAVVAGLLAAWGWRSR